MIVFLYSKQSIACSLRTVSYFLFQTYVSMPAQ